MLGCSRMLCGFKVESLVARAYSDRAYFKMCKGQVCTSRQKHASTLGMTKSKVLQYALQVQRCSLVMNPQQFMDLLHLAQLKTEIVKMTSL